MRQAKFWLQKANWSHRIDVAVLVHNGECCSMASPLTFEPTPVTEVTRPAFSMTLEQAQDFMDQLWQCGLRPSDGSGSAGSLAATERHLADMRRLVFDTPPKGEKP